MKIAKLDRWAMLLQGYNITFVHIRGKDHILAEAISRLHTINVYDDTVQNKQQHSVGTAAQFHNTSTTAQHKYYNIEKSTENKISFVKIEYMNYTQILMTSVILTMRVS